MNEKQIAGERKQDLENLGMWRLAKPCRQDSYKQKPIQIEKHEDRNAENGLRSCKESQKTSHSTSMVLNSIEKHVQTDNQIHIEFIIGATGNHGHETQKCIDARRLQIENLIGIQGNYRRFTKLVGGLVMDVKEIKQDQTAYQQELRELKRENEVLREENKKAKEDVKDIETRMRNLEKKQIKNNIVISEIKMDIKIGLKNFIERNMGTKIQIKEATKIGATIKLRSLQENVYINSEPTKGEQETQKKIKEIADNERKKGKQVKGWQTERIERMLHLPVQKTKKEGKREKNEENPSNG
ncbi:hypothetical protein ILUMI_13016 [Ignelater luminosus]|uniref:Uncharacterized protein n=1 Tax=Ignelater luminosus TaxID=2038154 RepID=A0A8K0GB94_IGNLU|nr:hypothetical protein ILUMI_13016 [Ignelater luminosus]